MGVRHFDCIGLVNFCYSAAAKTKFQYGVLNFVTDDSAAKAGYVKLERTKVRPGDIVTIGSEHIGIVTEKSTAIEANSTGIGVVERPLSQGTWTGFWYVPESMYKS